MKLFLSFVLMAFSPSLFADVPVVQTVRAQLLLPYQRSEGTYIEYSQGGPRSATVHYLMRFGNKACFPARVLATKRQATERFQTSYYFMVYAQSDGIICPANESDPSTIDVVVAKVPLGDEPAKFFVNGTPALPKQP